jgi:glycosyltransferase involved in cell wall biosynthesis
MTPAPAVPTACRVAVVIPCYKVTAHILGVLARIGPEVGRVYCVDDACPQGSGDLVERECRDPRVRVVRNPANLGVGGAVMAGYRQAMADGAEVLVKIDGDGQMDPALVPAFVAPIARGEADYTKGNRFFDLAQIHQMPALRIAGNAALSLLTKLSTGYWDVFDPTNGYTAIHARAAGALPFDKISSRYFFESDMLFRLGTFRAVVVDVPMDARYGDEQSGLQVGRILGEFAGKHLRNFSKRLFYNYFLRDFPLASLELVLGLALLGFGVAFGGWHWWLSSATGIAASAGTVMIPTMSVLVGLQLVLAFLAYDIANVPRRPLQSTLGAPAPAAPPFPDAP